LRLDAPRELPVQSLDGIGGSDGLPLALREAKEREESLAGFLQAVGDGAALEPPLVHERLALLLQLLGRVGVYHAGVVSADLVVERVKEGIPCERRMLADAEDRRGMFTGKPTIDDESMVRTRSKPN
jgi:hypothetical protein